MKLPATFKELNDGRYRLTLQDDLRKILIKALAYRLCYAIQDELHENVLIEETITALQKETIKLRKSELLILFSETTMQSMNYETQTFLNAWLNFDEVKRRMAKPKLQTALLY